MICALLNNQFFLAFLIVFPATIMHIFGLKVKLEPSAVRNLVFEYVRLNQKADAQSLIDKISVPSQTLCAIACNRNKNCLSFNFCHRKTCELNGVDVFSTIEGEKLLVNATGCKYIGIRKTERPLCEEKGIQKSIQDDVTPGICQINKKRVDRQWGPWEVLDFDTSSGWGIVEEKRLLLEAAHGGIVSHRPQGKTIQEYVFVYTLYSWLSARDNCQRLGGSLLHDLDGTTDQLDKFIARSNTGEYFWLGFKRAAPNSENWENVDGAQAQLIENNTFQHIG